MIELCAIGGYNEIGRNMTAIKVDDKVIIIDMGLYLPAYIEFTEDEDIKQIPVEKLVKVGAVPDDSVIDDWKSKVVAIVPTHAHLDHLGALPFISNNYKAEILCTPYTKELILTICRDERLKLNNRIKTLSPNSKYKLADDLTLEFIHTTHSTPHAVMVALHTKYGVVLYCNDFKFDSFPVLGKKPNFKRLKELGENGVKLLICDSTRADDAKKTPSESVARQMLKDLLLGIEADDKAILATTFSSHIARLKSIIDYGKRINRKVILLGRSLAKYVQAAERANLVNFSKDVKIVKYSSKVQSALKLIEKNKQKYLLVVTGHQGESKAVLSKIARGEFDGFKLDKDDAVIFSCSVIPNKINIDARELLEKELKNSHVRIFKDIHVSGHAAREDIRDLIKMVKPEKLIPAHCENHMKQAMKELAEECDVSNVIMINDGEKITILP
ncbi:MAG: RNase J family beta-CASP ribonuclease [Candidatus Woesearchaeota archaeon]